MLKWPLHFLFDFFYTYSRGLVDTGDNPSTSMLEKLSSVLEAVEGELDIDDKGNDNPVLWALQSRFPNLFGFWDVWDSLEVEPGDIGVMMGNSPKRPAFRKLTNVAEQISGSKVFSELRELVYEPDASLWSTDVLDGGIIRLVYFAFGLILLKC